MAEDIVAEQLIKPVGLGKLILTTEIKKMGRDKEYVKWHDFLFSEEEAIARGTQTSERIPP